MRKIFSAALALVCIWFATPSWGALPSGYTELSYIESTGTQYIDTGISNVNGWKVDINFAFVGTQDFLVGANASAGEGFLIFRPGTSELYGRNNGKIFNESVNYTGASVHNAVAEMFTDSTKVELDGQIIVNESSSGTRANEMVKILSIYGNNTKAGRIYNAKFYNQSNTMVRNLVPAKNSSGVVGMYDTVNNRFYTNAGTGEFIAGDPVTDNSCRNLFDKTNYTEINAFVNANTGVLTSGSSGAATQYSAVIPCKPNTTYTISGRGISSWGAFTSSDVGTTATSFSKVENGSITTGANDRYLIGLIRANSNTIDYRNDLQIEEGSTATSYVPYNPQCATCDGTMVNYTSATGTVSRAGTPTPTNPIEPTFYKQGNMVLRKGGDYADSYDASTGKITRRVGVKVLDGTENWGIQSINDHGIANYQSTMAGMHPSSGSNSMMSSHFGATGSLIAEARGPGLLKSSGDTYFIRISSETASTVAQFKSWLAAQKAAGTPVTIYYVLENPVEEDWTETSYCETPIKIATTKYNETKFSPLNTALANAISVVDTVVSNTITQAASIATLQTQKQTRPNDIADDSEKCPAYKQCLLVEDENGTPHWYEITDPFRDFVAPIIANNVAPASTTNSSGFTQLQYIESTGTQLIDTGVTVNSNLKTELEMAVMNQVNGHFCGGRSAETAGAGFGIGVIGGKFVFDYEGRITSDVSPTVETRYKIIKDKKNNYIYLNGRLLEETSNSEIAFSSDVHFGLFAIMNSNVSALYTRMYYAKIYNDGTLVRNMIPAKRNSDGAIGMYDTVSKTFFVNKGTGTFTAGPNVANTDVPTNPTWTATWAANATTGVSAGTVYGEALCNGVSSSQSVVATSAQMSSANWDVDGVNCWCHMTVLDNGNIISTTNDSSYVFHSTSGTNSACMTNCASFCERTIRDYAGFRNPVLQM